MKILTACNAAWHELHEITYPSKKAYAQHWGLDIEVREYREPFSFFDRSRIILEAMEAIRENEWIWWMGSDVLVMNQSKSLSNLAPFNAPIVVCNDIHGINDDSMFFRKCPEVRMLLRVINGDFVFKEKPFEHFQDGLQKCIDEGLIAVDIRNNQSEFNSYLYSALYGKEYYYTPEEYASSGGDYKEGDFILHFPGIPYARKLELAREYARKVK